MCVATAYSLCQGGQLHLFDGTRFSNDDPIGYLNQLAIKRDFSVTEFDLKRSALPVAA